MNEKLTFCDTKYPVVLVSGLGFTEHHALYDYWGPLPDYLKLYGAPVFTANQDAFASHVDNALNLKYRIYSILEKTKKDKVNIIGHSKGGIESRYMISKLDMGNEVASLTSLGSPHTGAGIADVILGRIKIGRIAAARLMNIYARIMGDKKPDSMRALISVSREAMVSFNNEVTDDPRVYYQSFSGIINKDYPNFLWRTLAGILYLIEGSNDGLVGVESTKWGNYRGFIQDDKIRSVSHADMVGMHVFTGVSEFDYKKWFANLIHELKEMGY